MKDILAQLRGGKSLSAEQAEGVFARIMAGEAASGDSGGGIDPAQVGALLTLLAVREPTVEELIGVSQVMRRHVVRIPVPEEMAGRVIDTCGTGGVGSRIFNVSTTAALVAAACGVPVAKHGNRSITSRSGSSDVLRLLGVTVETTPEVEARCLREAGICFAFAPKHHPAMRHVAGIRQALGFATIFNLVGPLTNPAGARRQLVGVKSPELANKVLAVLVELGAERALVVNGRAQGTDSAAEAALCELSISGPTYVVGFDGKQGLKYTLTPEDVGLRTQGMEEMEIESAAESAALVRDVLEGRPGPARDIVLLNAAGALWVGGKVEELKDGVRLAAEAIGSGAARRVLERLAAVSRGNAGMQRET